MDINCLNNLRIMGSKTELDRVSKAMEGTNPVTSEKELLCTNNYITLFSGDDKNTNLSRPQYLKQRKEMFDDTKISNITCDKGSSTKYIEYEFCTNKIPPMELLMRISVLNPSLDFALSYYNPVLNIKGKLRLRNGGIIAAMEGSNGI
jgi:hypothetical protein